MKKICLITGATSGIGEATAIQFAKQHWNLILNGRRADKLEQLSANLTNNFGTKVLNLLFDVRNREDAVRCINNMDTNWKKIDVLVNNAGLAVGLNPIHEGIFDDWDRMIDTNIKGLLTLTRLIAPLMIENGKGHIVNIGSIAGKEVYPNGNVYCATKHAVDALSKAMRIDLLPYNIKVSQVCPGAVNTEFSIVRFKGDVNKADAVYQGYQPLTATDIADAIFYVCNAPNNVCINDIMVMPYAQANTSVLIRKS
ncbi:MAG: SDR family NAD(P)-dependent oxidoreductase [Lentimicrobiaceae bacterium]|nr:SDR family NAD(P)-dependent oxidoreductase [Lentimicrobiaceae bacterium]